MTKVFFILLGLLAASGLALAATVSHQFSAAGQAAPAPAPEPIGSVRGFADPSRFIVSGEFPKEKLAKVVADFKAGKIEAPKAIKLPAAYANPGTWNIKHGTNEESKVLLSGGNSSVPTGFSDPYCPYNKGAFGNDPQCGGGPKDYLDHTQCTYNMTIDGGPSFYENCNYGNNPNVRQHFGTLSPEHPSPICPTDSTPVCDCPIIYTPPCGYVKRLKPPGCNGCCPPLPVSCEQCCAGSAWLYDTFTKGCSCGIGP